MNKIILTLITFMVIGMSCKKADYRKDAQIIGYDLSLCLCCGGYMVRLNDEPATKLYLAKSLPSNVGINPASTFPISVEVDYTIKKNSCNDKFID